MTDARADALTAPTADPGIVAAIVYAADRIADALEARQQAASAAPSAPQDDPALGDAPGATRPYANGYRRAPWLVEAMEEALNRPIDGRVFANGGPVHPDLTIPAGATPAEREAMVREFLEREGTR